MNITYDNTPQNLIGNGTMKLLLYNESKLLKHIQTMNQNV